MPGMVLCKHDKNRLRRSVDMLLLNSYMYVCGDKESVALELIYYKLLNLENATTIQLYHENMIQIKHKCHKKFMVFMILVHMEFIYHACKLPNIGFIIIS